jgi:hypothetical protein
LRTQLSENTPPIRHASLNESQGQLLGHSVQNSLTTPDRSDPCWDWPSCLCVDLSVGFRCHPSIVGPSACDLIGALYCTVSVLSCEWGFNIFRRTSSQIVSLAAIVFERRVLTIKQRSIAVLQFCRWTAKCRPYVLLGRTTSCNEAIYSSSLLKVTLSAAAHGRRGRCTSFAKRNLP